MQVFMKYLRILAFFTFIKDTALTAFFNCQIQNDIKEKLTDI